MPNRVDIAAFQKVMIVYNRNSGKQLFASVLARVRSKKRIENRSLIRKVWKLLKLSLSSRLKVWQLVFVRKNMTG